MSTTALDKLIQQNVDDGSEVVCSGPVDDGKIQRAEALLGLTFPPSYKEYLSHYGAIEIDGRSFGGLTSRDAGESGDVVAFTRNAREQYSLPDQYIAIDFQDGDAFFCIDTNQKDSTGEAPVVLISPESGRQHGGIVAKSLIDYLERYLST
jgi:hypothetical protein